MSDYWYPTDFLTGSSGSDGGDLSDQAHRSWDDLIKKLGWPGVSGPGFGYPGTGTDTNYLNALNKAYEDYYSMTDIPALYSGYNLAKQNLANQMNAANLGLGEQMRAQNQLAKERSQAAAEEQMKAKYLQAQGLARLGEMEFRNYMDKLNSLLQMNSARSGIDMSRWNWENQQDMMEQQGLADLASTLTQLAAMSIIFG